MAILAETWSLPNYSGKIAGAMVTTKTFLVHAQVPGTVNLSKRKAIPNPSRVNPTRRSLGLAGRLTVEQARAAARPSLRANQPGARSGEVEQAEQAAREAETLRQINFADVLEAWILIRAVKFRRRVCVVRESQAMLNPLDIASGCVWPSGVQSPRAPQKYCVLHPTTIQGSSGALAPPSPPTGAYRRWPSLLFRDIQVPGRIFCAPPLAVPSALVPGLREQPDSSNLGKPFGKPVQRLVRGRS